MSREYYYYPAIKKEDGYYPILFEKKEEGLEPATCYWHYDHIDEDTKDVIEEHRISPNSLKGEFRKYFYLDEIEPNMIYAFVLDRYDIEKFADNGLVIGYVPIDIALECKDDIEAYKEEMISAEIYAELPNREDYVRVSFVDRFSLGYIASRLNDGLWNIEGDACIIAYYSY